VWDGVFGYKALPGLGGEGSDEEEEEEQEEEVREQDEVHIVVVGGALRFEARKNKEGSVFAGWIDPR
jgi:hypothetical protein